MKMWQILGLMVMLLAGGILVALWANEKAPPTGLTPMAQAQPATPSAPTPQALQRMPTVVVYATDPT